MNIPVDERDPDVVADLKKLIKRALEDVITAADVLFTTTVMFTHKLARGFREKYDFVAIEEAGPCTVLDVCIVWKAVKLVLAGDPYQLPPFVKSARAEYDGVPANAFPQQIQMPLLYQLILNGWLYWLVPEQLRIDPGLWELALYVIYYNEKITIPEGKLPSQAVKDFESWAIGFGAAASDEASPENPKQVFSVLLDIEGAGRFVEARGTFKGNTQFIHFGVSCCLSQKRTHVWTRGRSPLSRHIRNKLRCGSRPLLVIHNSRVFE